MTPEETGKWIIDVWNGLKERPRNFGTLDHAIADAIRSRILEERQAIIDQLENGPPNGITSIGVVAMIKARAKP